MNRSETVSPIEPTLREHRRRKFPTKKHVGAVIATAVALIFGKPVINTLYDALYDTFMLAECGHNIYQLSIDTINETVLVPALSGVPELPQNYALPSGEIINFDFDKLQELRSKAIEESQPVIIDLMQVPTDKETPTMPSSEHPVVQKLPEDVLSDEELKKYNINIIQADNITLSIRKGAFSPGGPLEMQSRYMTPLTIVLVDGYYIDRRFLEDDQYPPVKTSCPAYSESSAIEFRESRIQALTYDINKLRHDLDYANSKNRTLLAQDLEEMILKLEARLSIIQLQSPVDFVGDWTSNGGTVGFFVGKRDQSIIYICVGQKERKQYLLFYFDQLGRFNMKQVDWDSGKQNYVPQASQAFPNPDEFKPNIGNRDYPFEMEAPGQILNHEIIHKMLSEPFRETDTESTINRLFITRLREAWTRWSQKQDDGGYYFVFSLPDGTGYIITGQDEQELPSFFPKSSG